MFLWKCNRIPIKWSPPTEEIQKKTIILLIEPMFYVHILIISEVHHVKIIAANLPKFTKQICKAEAQLAWRMRYHWWINGQIWKISILYDIFAVAISNSKYISYIIAGVSGKRCEGEGAEPVTVLEHNLILIWFDFSSVFCFQFKKNNKI